MFYLLNYSFDILVSPGAKERLVQITGANEESIKYDFIIHKF